MKRNIIIYWIATGLLALQMTFAGILYFTDPNMAAGFNHFGFPDYFRYELGIAKLIAAAVILLPMIPLRVKEWAYAGLGITFLSALVAHASVDGLGTAVMPIVSLVLLAVSYIYLHKRITVRKMAAA